MTHKFQAGDRVRLTSGFLDQSGDGDDEVVRVLPANVDGEMQYRVRGADGFERAIGEHQIKTTKAADDVSR